RVPLDDLRAVVRAGLRAVERLDVARFAVVLPRLAVPLARLVAVFVVRRTVLVAPRAGCRAPVALLFAVALAPLARLDALDAPARARLPAAFVADRALLPAAFAARLAAGFARRVDPDAAAFAAVRAERTAVLPLFEAALRCRVAAAFLAAAERCAFV